MSIDASQRFIFGLEGSPEPLGSFKLDNIYVPALGSPSFTNVEIRNNALSGYRWIHETTSTETYGSFRLQKFLSGSPTGVDLITFNDNGTFSFPGTTDAKYILQTANANLPNAQVLGSLATGLLKNTTTTGVLSIAIPGTDYATLANRLDQFAIPTADLNLNSQRITNLLDPLNNQDATTKAWVNAQIAANLNLPRLGIGINPTVDGRIQFANTLMVNKLSFYNTTGNDYNQSGLGYDSFGTSYHVPTGLAHNFYLGSSTNIALQINPLGLYIDQLKPINSDYRRIMFYDPSENLHQIYNIGIKTLDGTNHAIHFQVSSSQAAFTWAQGLTSVSSYELMRLNNDKLIINNGKLTILEPASLTSWDLTPVSDGTFSLQKSDLTANKFTFNSATLSSILSILNPNSSAVSYFKSGTSTDSVQLGYDGANDYSFINIQGPSNDRLAFRVNGTGVAALLQSGLFGLGTIAPTAAKLQVNGGVQNVIGEESCIRVISALSSAKIEIQNTTPTTGKLYELRSSSTGNFDITDRTGSATRFSITSAGNIGINMGLGTPNAPLQFVATAASRKIVLSETANNDHQVYGLGVNTNVFRYQVPANTADYVFYAGVNSTTSNEVGRITGTGDYVCPGVIYGHGPFGLIYFASNVTTTAVTAGVYTKMSGTTSISAVGLSQFSMPASNRLQYNGIPAGLFKISAIVSIQHNQILGTSVSIALYKNGVQLVPSIMTEFQGGSAQSIILTTSDIINLSTGDYVEIYLTAAVNATLTPAYATLMVTSI